MEEYFGFLIARSILLLVNLTQFFFLFFISYIGREKNTYIGFLIMILSFYRTIKYSNLIISQTNSLNNFFINISNSFMNKIDFLNIKNNFGIINSKDTSAFIHTLQFACIFFEICYCYEYVKMFKNPLSFGGDIHYLSILVPIIYLIIRYFIILKFNLHLKWILNKDNNDWFWALMLLSSILIYIFLIIYSLFIIHQANSNLLIQKSSKILFIRHVCYVISFLCVFCNCVYTTSFEDPNESPLYRCILFGIIEIILVTIRLFEIHIFKCGIKKKNLVSIINDTILKVEEESRNCSINDKFENLIIDEEINKIKLNSQKISKILETEIYDKNASDIVHSSTVLLSIFYIIEGIIFTVSNYDDSKIEIDENNIFKTNKKEEKILESSQKVNYYQYRIRNNVLNDISVLPSNEIKSYKRLFRNKVYLVEYYPEYFKKLRKLDNLRNENIIQSFDFDNNILNFVKIAQGEGKSGSLFFLTYDKKLYLKTISDYDLKSLTNIFFIDYYKYILINRYSLLVRIYGIYTINIGVSHVNMILMENICPINNDNLIKYKFDLKGSFYGRNTKNLIKNKKTKTLKDLDFLDVLKIEPNLIYINSFQKELFEGIMKNDLELLTKCNFMDYSLFIVILNYNEELIKQTTTTRMYVSKDRKYAYYLGIIDYLSYYGIRKKIENLIKTFFLCQKNNKTNISAVNSQIYSQRFSKFMRKIFKGKKNKND